MKCEGWRRYGGALSFGTPTWTQCSNEAIAMITVKQDGEIKTLPGCSICWQECINNGIEIVKTTPIVKEEKNVT